MVLIRRLETDNVDTFRKLHLLGKFLHFGKLYHVEKLVVKFFYVKKLNHVGKPHDVRRIHLVG
jgi:hypothetical protein